MGGNNNVLKYKDFIGTVNFSTEDGVFYGKIEGIKSMISFEGETVQDLEHDFKTAVDDYIEYCKRHNIKNFARTELSTESYFKFKGIMSEILKSV